MSGTYNKAVIVGRLGRDPELKYTPNGTPICTMSVATDESYKDQSGQVQKKTEWHRVVVWGKQAENVSQYLAKGRAALVEGRLQTRSWDDQQGIKRYVTEIKADRVVFLSSGQGQGGVPAPGDQDAPANVASGGDDVGPVFPVDFGEMDEASF